MTLTVMSFTHRKHKSHLLSAQYVQSWQTSLDAASHSDSAKSCLLSKLKISRFSRLSRMLFFIFLWFQSTRSTEKSQSHVTHATLLCEAFLVFRSTLINHNLGIQRPPDGWNSCRWKAFKLPNIGILSYDGDLVTQFWLTHPTALKSSLSISISHGSFCAPSMNSCSVNWSERKSHSD